VRRDAKLADAREKLARLENGGAAAHPLDVESASQIEVRALSMPCLRCDGPYRLDEHTAEQVEGDALRIVQMHCGHCGAPRVVYFRVVPARAS
jgi:hypothetical protein